MMGSNLYPQVGACLISKNDPEDRPMIVEQVTVRDDTGLVKILWAWIDENGDTCGTMTDEEARKQYNTVDLFDDTMPELEESRNAYHAIMSGAMTDTMVEA